VRPSLLCGASHCSCWQAVLWAAWLRRWGASERPGTMAKSSVGRRRPANLAGRQLTEE
jgi:hypothetical protein